MMAHVPFLRVEFSLMAMNVKWVVLLYLVAKDILVLRVSPLVVKEEWDQWPRLISNCSYSSINADSLPIAVLSSMQ